MHAEKLARAGLRCCVIEQTETPDQLAIRNESRGPGQPKVRLCHLYFGEGGGFTCF